MGDRTATARKAALDMGVTSIGFEVSGYNDDGDVVPVVAVRNGAEVKGWQAITDLSKEIDANCGVAGNRTGEDDDGYTRGFDALTDVVRATLDTCFGGWENGEGAGTEGRATFDLLREKVEIELEKRPTIGWKP
jgi:hypothetical protein